MCSPLFDFIPLDHVIINTLHLFLRISDVLIELLITREYAIDKKLTFDKGFARDTYRHMDTYEKFLHSIDIVFGIVFERSVDKHTKKLSYRDLTGPEKFLLSKNSLSKTFCQILLII